MENKNHRIIVHFCIVSDTIGEALLAAMESNLVGNTFQSLNSFFSKTTIQ